MRRSPELLSANKRPFPPRALSKVVESRSARVAALLLALFGGGTGGCQTQHRPLPDTPSAKIEMTQDSPDPWVSVSPGETWPTVSLLPAKKVSEDIWETRLVYTYPPKSDNDSDPDKRVWLREEQPGERSKIQLSHMQIALLNNLEPFGITDIKAHFTVDQELVITLSTDKHIQASDTSACSSPIVFQDLPDKDRQAEVIVTLAEICTGKPECWRVKAMWYPDEERRQLIAILENTWSLPDGPLG